MSSSVRSLFESGTDASAPTWVPVALELVGVGVAAAMLALFGGTFGTLTAVVLALVWVALPVEYTLAAGQVALVAVTSDPIDVVLLVGVQVMLGLFLVGALWTVTASLTASAKWSLTYVGLGCGLWYIAVGPGQVWHGAVLLWVVGVAAAYGLYRHELVILGQTKGKHH